MSKRNILTLLLLFTFINVSAQIGSVSVKTWSDDKKSAFSFTFDDGFISQYQTALPILNSFGFKGTFYLITGQLNETLPGNWRYGSWEQFREMANQGHEIGSHTVTHPDLTTLSSGNKTTPNTLHYELYQSKIKIEEKIPGFKVITTAYPYIAHNTQVDNVTENYYEAGRSGGNTLNNSILTPVQRLGLYSKKVEFKQPRNSLADDADDMANFKNYVQNSIDQEKWSAIMIHEIYPFSHLQTALEQGAYYPMTSEWLTSLCEWLTEKSSNNEVWVETAANILKYSRERETFASVIVSQSDTLLELNVSDALDNSIYNFPLTVDIIIPQDWDTVSIIQNEMNVTAYSFNDGINKVVRANIIPDNGNVTLIKKSTPASIHTYTISGNIKYSDKENIISNVKIDLTSQASGESVLSDNEGNFIFSDILPGNYNLQISKEDSWGGVNATDALWALLYFTGSIELNSTQLLAADVTNDGKINATDALQILRRFSGQTSTFAKPDWIFEPASIEVNVIDENQTHELKAIATGDINKSFNP